ncbi:MAG: hypothetical protein HWD59_02625 [Coxiellaceae bacterium]|nr:MAG: hypothetical protein HWD59_02625 [Coxiellaceae bacterium]
MPSVAENYQVFCSLTPSQRGPATMGLPRLPAVDHNADHCSLAMTHSQEPKIQTLMQFSKILQFEDPVTKERYSEQGFQNALQAFDHALEKAKISPSLIAILQNHSFIAASDRTNHILLQSLEKTLAVTVYAANRRLQWQAEANNQLSITEIVYLYVSPKDIQMSNTSQGQQPLLVITNQYRLRVVQDEIKVSVSLSQFMLHQSVVTNLTKVNESADFWR